MGKKKKTKFMVMKSNDVSHRRRLLERWGFQCIVCGHEFANIACVTKEHIIPRCMHGTGNAENLAPSHHQCNKLRGVMSLFEAVKLLENKRSRMSDVQFFEWLNAPIPHRHVPPEALMPVRQLRFLELPEHLPGMR